MGMDLLGVARTIKESSETVIVELQKHSDTFESGFAATILQALIDVHRRMESIKFALGVEVTELIGGTEVRCAWCGFDLLAEESPYTMKHNDTQPVDYLCSDRCEMRHRAYAAQCKCGWWHSDTTCPKCGVAQ